MSDYEDFVESYGYSASDPDAMDSIMASWEQNEIIAKLNKEYEKDLLTGKNTPKKSYYNSKIKKFGFNNFKPFGNTVQTFSKKPITLIYGPNSIGKSSLIHINAYMRYINKTKNLNLKSTDMFGDNINIGGFNKFIYKRDTSNTLTLEYEFDDCSEAIIDYCEIKEDSQETIDALLKFTLEDIKNIIIDSEQYVRNFHIKTVGGPLFGKESSEINTEIRKNNNLCNIIYLDEILFLQDNYKVKIKEYYKYKEYLFSNFSSEDKFKNENDSILNFNLSRQKNEFLNEKKDFLSDNKRNKFISDILIPYYINDSKLSYLSLEGPVNQLYNKYPKTLTDLQIEEIAKKTLQLISNVSLKKDFLKTLKESNIPLKILVTINQSNLNNQVKISSVKYFINNELFDHVKNNGNSAFSKIMRDIKEKNELFLRSLSSVNPKFDISGYKVPTIFQDAPDTIFNRIYYESNGATLIDKTVCSKNNLHESNESILFLSYKAGYDNLIGAFNDMIGFDNMQYIGPLRFYPERDSSFKELDSDTSKIPDSQTSWSYLKEDNRLRTTINSWLADDKKLKTPYEIKYRKLYDMNNIVKNNEDIAYNELLEKYLTIFDPDNFEDYVDENGHSDISEGTYNTDENGYLRKKDRKFMFTALVNSLLSSVDFKEELVFEDLRTNTQINNRDLGLGISQILPILIATNHQRNMTIAIEQPELHLHPSVQCEVADEFIRSYKQNKNEFLIETHSEHLLLRIMKRMRHTAENRVEKGAYPLTPNDVCLLYVDSHKGKTFIRELKLDNDGTLLSKWPNGFFEESYNEMFS